MNALRLFCGTAILARRRMPGPLSSLADQKPALSGER
jgi:hypothetical protein